MRSLKYRWTCCRSAGSLVRERTGIYTWVAAWTAQIDFWNLNLGLAAERNNNMSVYRRQLCLRCWERVFSAVSVASCSCCVLLVVDLEGQRTFASLYTAAYWDCQWLLLILLFLYQELPAANPAPVYRHYSHGATLAHNWVTSAKTSWCLPEPPQWLWAVSKQ